MGKITQVKTHYMATIIKTAWYGQKDHTNQWNRTELPETDPCKYTQLICLKYKSNSMEKNSLFDNGAGTVAYPLEERKEKEKEKKENKGKKMT